MVTKKAEEQTEVGKNPNPDVPEVYRALANVIKDLAVDKNGTLPGNMGGKPYITASDVAGEVKNQFVKNSLIFLPNEEVIKQETIQFKERLNVLITITGTYTIVSTVDGSSVVVSGTGDGLATGTAVASNIASTNAFKNALLRTFIITEQSVEDSAKQGEAAPAVQRQSAAQRKVDSARPQSDTKNPKDEIRVEYIETGKVSKEQVNTALQAHNADGKTNAEAFVLILKDLKDGKDL